MDRGQEIWYNNFSPVPDRSVKQRNDEEVRNGQTGRISITDVQVPFRIFQD